MAQEFKAGVEDIAAATLAVAEQPVVIAAEQPVAIADNNNLALAVTIALKS